MKNIVGISEIVLWTANKEKALHFYRDLLGLEVISPPTLPNIFLRGGVHPVLASRTMYIDDPDGNEVEFICHALAI